MESFDIMKKLYEICFKSHSTCYQTLINEVYNALYESNEDLNLEEDAPVTKMQIISAIESACDCLRNAADSFESLIENIEEVKSEDEIIFSFKKKGYL